MLYIPTFGIKQLHLPEYTGFVATLVGGLVLAIGCPLAGHWSDKTARPLIMVIMCSLFVLTAYPAFYLMVAWPSLAACIIAVAWLQASQGRLQRRSAVADVRAVPGRNPRDRRVLELQHQRDDLWRLCPVCRNLADRRRPATRFRRAIT